MSELPTNYGIQYVASELSSWKEKAPRNLQTLGIKFVRLQWVDLVNNIRYRVIPVKHFLKMLSSDPRPSVCLTKASMGLVFINLAEGFGAAGEYLYVADMDSLRVCPYAPGHASVMGWFEEKNKIVGRDGLETLQAELCPRTMVRRVEQEAKQLFGIDFLLGFEIEFILLKSTDPIEAVNYHGWSNSPALPTGAVETMVLEEIADSLDAAGIELQMYHAEAAPGQYEVVTGPLSPLESCDALIFTRETIFNIASKYGLRATLAPRVYNNNCGSGAHIHFSLHTPQPPSLPDSPSTSLTPLEASFLSTILDSLPALCALTLPTAPSYSRVIDGVWSGGTYVSYGIDNRESPVRICGTSSSRHFEMKCLDGTANPYLAIAGILGAGLEGVKNKSKLEILECSDHPAALLSEEERKVRGVTARLPSSIQQAREWLGGEEGATIRKVLGDNVVEKYISVNKTLEQAFGEGTEAEIMKRIVENY
ncbi:hypothetical protein JAAARDRAFT_191833 [Jaapia argillacea MUCL 33604]|uniref:Glutamine synthetase n=1 Tax=Jaapia argillacea MUCL 33604 TaxID=933084 RepID=A0A067Q0I8_9AGAM|nr:hypothetical protein JAAARDRAFT_191833 [Jaapia argillacea MUCL 33604]